MSYLQELEANLSPLPQEEIKDALFYYEQYFFEGQLTDGQAVAEFGTPKNLARRLVADYYMDETRVLPHAQQKSPFVMTKMVVLAICASPILIPVMIAGLALIFALFITVAALIFALLMTVLAVGCAGLVSVVGGFFVLTQSFLGGLFFVAVGLALIGGLLLSWPMVLALIRWFKESLNQMIAWIGRKTIGRLGGER